jgi:hypothetical protein
LTNLALVKHLGWSSTLLDLVSFPYGEANDDIEKHVAKPKNFLQDAEANSCKLEPDHDYLKEAEKVDNTGKAAGSSIPRSDRRSFPLNVRTKKEGQYRVKYIQG